MTSKVDALLTISTNQESAGKFNLVLTFPYMYILPHVVNGIFREVLVLVFSCLVL